MALSFAHGVVQWKSADAVATQYTVSGLSFQPKALRFYWFGLGSTTDQTANNVHSRRGVGFAVSAAAADQLCVATFDQDLAGSAVCISEYNTGLIALTLGLVGPATDGSLKVASISSDGFVLEVVDTAPVDIVIFWESWGGTDITVAKVGSIAEPAATGNQDYTVTGFVSGATDQIVMFAGIQSTSAAGTAVRTDSGLCVGFAQTGAAGDNICILGNSDDGSGTSDTDGYSLSGECLAMIALAGGNPNARAQLTQFNTDGFRLNWIAVKTTNRRSIFLAIKGGQWKVGEYTINATGVGQTATVSGLAFQPIGLSVIGAGRVEDTPGTATTTDYISCGSGTSTTSRRAQGHGSETGVADMNIGLTVQYDAILSFPLFDGTQGGTYDIDAINSDGFRIIVDIVGGGTTQWQGYLAFASAPSTGGQAPRSMHQYRQRRV